MNGELAIVKCKAMEHAAQFPACAVTGMAVALLAQTTCAQEPLSGNYFAHDPSTIIKDGSRYYYFRTDQGISINWSTDLRNWNGGGRVFPGGPPAWTTSAVTAFTGFFWAPDIAYFNGQYHLYYSCSSWGSQMSAIGLVTTTSLNAANWIDQGPVIQSTTGSPYNCIDPGVLVEANGNVWMVFGSYWNGIYLVQLDPVTGLRIAPNSPVTRLADNGSIEAGYLFQRGGYYYLFVNHGSCCSGVDSTYTIRVGRSSSIAGPYLDRDGISMLVGGGTVLLESTGPFIGPGHAGILVEDGTNWLSYHYYDGNDNGNAKLGLGRLEWTAAGWPVLTNDWAAFYTFEFDAREHLARYNGALHNGAAVVAEPGRSKVLSLDGADDYVDLPLSVANARTFAAWVKWNGGDDWQRIFDFGTGTARYLFLTPRANDGRMRFAIRNGGAEQQINAPTALPVGSWCHVAVTLDGARGVLYLNGDPVAANNTMTIHPWQLLARSNYVGESQFAADPTFSGLVDSLRIFGRSLSAAEIKEIVWAHPSLAHRYDFSRDASDAIGMAHGRLRGAAVVTNGALILNGTSGTYVNLPGGLVSGCAATTVEFWGTFGVNGSWARVFDFGRTSGALGQRYLFYCPHTGSGGNRLEMSTSAGTVTFDGSGSMDGRAVQVACVVDPMSGYTAVYTNGVRDRALNAALPALGGVSRQLAYLGRSLFSADAWLNGSIDEFRIYDGRLTPEEIAASYLAGPDAPGMPVHLSASNSSAGLTLSWPDYAVGFGLESSIDADQGAAWTPVANGPVLTSGEFRQTFSLDGTNRFFRLRR